MTLSILSTAFPWLPDSARWLVIAVLVLIAIKLWVMLLAADADKRKYQIGAKESERLRHWVLVANAKGRYSRGSSETLLDQDLATLRQGGGADELIDRLRLQVGRLDNWLAAKSP